MRGIRLERGVRAEQRRGSCRVVSLLAGKLDRVQIDAARENAAVELDVIGGKQLLKLCVKSILGLNLRGTHRDGKKQQADHAQRQNEQDQILILDTGMCRPPFGRYPLRQPALSRPEAESS